MKSFGQIIVAARKAAGLTQKFVAESLRRGDGRKVLPPFLNDLEHDRRYPPEDAVINQLAHILKLSSDVLYFYAKRVPPDIRRNATDAEVEAAYRAFRAGKSSEQAVLSLGSRRHYSASMSGSPTGLVGSLVL